MTNRFRSSAWVLLVLAPVLAAPAQPRAVEQGVLFAYPDQAERSVVLLGDFNGWSADLDSLRPDGDGIWRLTRPVPPGLYQYKFLVDGTRYELDPGNPVRVENYNRSSENSAFLVALSGEVVLTAVRPESTANPEDVYPAAADRRAVHLNIIWHQHQPLYVNPSTDQLTAPWVRTHATKDYYDMVAMLRDYPDIHCTVNLTSSLLVQLQDYYVARLLPFVDTRRGTIDREGFLRRWGGKTDPWIDLALRSPATYTPADKDHLYRNSWNAFGVSEVMMERFPQYRALRDRLPESGPRPDDLFAEQELREIIFWFYAAQFDPDFLRGAVTLPDGSVCDLSDLIEERPDGTFVTRRPIAEEDCHRMVVEAAKVIAGVVPIHRELRLDPAARTGQIDVITTPYYHPILPLLYDSDAARPGQPRDSLPQRFHYPEDAADQVAMAVQYYRSLFGSSPTGMWPAEGSVSQDVLPSFRRHGVEWIASDAKVLRRSTPPDRPNTTPYRFPAGTDSSIALVFRDTELSDRIGFRYQSYEGEEAAEDFVRSILDLAPRLDEPDVLVTVILDGENAWEWYQKDTDAKTFLHALYRKLSALHRAGRILTVTTGEYIAGNPARGVTAHPALPVMERLWPGSWINANFDTWIGEWDENRAWEYLLTARQDLERSGLPKPLPDQAPPETGTPAWFSYKAWHAMYAAEGSDWFWWYGTDQSAPGGDAPFDAAFRTHLNNVYEFARGAGASLPDREFPPIIDDAVPTGRAGAAGGTMARSSVTRRLLFTCDARGVDVPEAIYITGSIPELGEWTPNVVRLHDDGTHGDRAAGDGIWSLEMEIPRDIPVHYKYTNSGRQGVWGAGDESPGSHRTVTVTEAGPDQIDDTFGR